jgi:beta-glucosidase/6-phospho-beta-glucosidase/beta-galactosidase
VKYGATFYGCHTALDTCCCEVQNSGNKVIPQKHIWYELTSSIFFLPLQVSHYRFSIAWPRIFPLGSGTVPNQAGIEYYNKVIDMLLSANIVPMVTLYHWDLPQELQKYGGWTNRTTADLFADYVDVCFKHFGDRVINLSMY